MQCGRASISSTLSLLPLLIILLYCALSTISMDGEENHHGKLRQECIQMKLSHQVEAGVTWGTLPTNMQK